jgi:dihydroorotase
MRFMKQLLKGGRVIDPTQNLDAVRDILIEDEVIVAIEPEISTTGVDEVHQLSAEYWVTPGLIDIHVHLRDPGRLDKETIQTGTEAAIAGGFTAVACMPNTTPVLDNLSTLEYVNNKVQREARIPVYPVCAATKNIAGEELSEMGELQRHGAVAFTDDGHCLMDSRLMRLALQYCAMLKVPFVCHAEDMNLSAEGCMNEGYTSTLLGLRGIPNVAESVIVGRDIQLSKLTGGHVHFAHVSARESVELIRQAKAEGLPITAETTPHYLALTDSAVLEYDPDFKMNPPLRTDLDQEALIEGLQDGTIDAIATDHAPHTPDDKGHPFDCCPNGVTGLETSLSVVLTYLVNPGKLTPMQMVERMSTGPARCLSLPGGTLKVGSRADITVIHPTLEWTVDPFKMKSKSRNTPFKGMTLQGKAVKVFSRGRELILEPIGVKEKTPVCSS